MDTNLNSYAGPQDNGKRIDLGNLNAAELGYASAIKLTSGLSSAYVTAGSVTGGHDACVDVNNLCRNVEIHVDELHPTGQFAATIKGGCQGVALYGHLYAHGRVADVIIGDWSDQSHDLTTGVVLGVTSMTGKPVRVLVLKGTEPLFVKGSGPYHFMFPQPVLRPLHTFFVFCFETLRRLGFFRGAANK